MAGLNSGTAGNPCQVSHRTTRADVNTSIWTDLGLSADFGISDPHGVRNSVIRDDIAVGLSLGGIIDAAGAEVGIDGIKTVGLNTLAVEINLAICRHCNSE